MYHLLISFSFYIEHQGLTERDVSHMIEGAQRISRLYSLFQDCLFTFPSFFNNLQIVYACLKENRHKLTIQFE